MANIPGARDVADNDTPGRDELNLRVDVNAARNAGLDPGTVARLVRLHLDGEVVGRPARPGREGGTAWFARPAHSGARAGGAG